MEQTYAYPAWLFTRGLSLVYLIAFMTLLPQARGLWGSQGVLPLAPYMKAVEAHIDGNRVWNVPSVFWLSTSDDFIWGAAATGAAFAFLALIGFAQGWALLMCFVLYTSFCVSGQDFMAFQWDGLLCELGFLALFMVPWNFDFSLGTATEPHWFVRGMFYIVLFKLMFLSGAVKLLSGDESWRDFSALNYHYLTQPLPNPLAPFFHELPSWLHEIAVGLTFAIELILPFFIFWSRTRAWTTIGFVLLSLSIMASGNYAFFNWLTIILCFWLLPDTFWHPLFRTLHLPVEPIVAAMFPHPVMSFAMAVLAVLSGLWCLRTLLPDQALDFLSPVFSKAATFHISQPYGLFATMTKSRPEIVIEGSSDGENWKEYEFKFKPGNVRKHPAVAAPFQPRLDWQMWFASLGPEGQSPWVRTLMRRLAENSPDVLVFFAENPFPETPPKYLRARLYKYEFNSVDSILESDVWWSRSLDREYIPPLTLQQLSL